MAKKHNKHQEQSGLKPVQKANFAPIASKEKKSTPQKLNTQSLLKKYSNLLLMAGIGLIIFLVLKTCLNNQFTNWDDPGYIKDNALIKDISSEGIKNIFSTPIMGNYHPLTILTYAIEYSYVRLEPYLYHRDSLLIHIFTTLAFFWFILLLTHKPIVATITALLFGLHPMHIESVAWVAARKDVLYGLFYAGSCIFYLYYIRSNAKKKWTNYILSFLLFTGSILSKPVAVSLPITLFLIDFFDGRKLFPSNESRSEQKSSLTNSFHPIIYLEKIPFLLIALGFGIKSVADQKEFKALNTLDVKFNIIERISLGAYALITYLWKAIAPIGLSNFYPYPVKVNDALPIQYYLYPIITLLLIALFWFFVRKNKIAIFGCLFFLVNIILLLQFIPVGGAILADRYTYIPYLGLFFIMGWYVSLLLEQPKYKSIGLALVTSVFVYISILGFLSNKRCMDWYDTISLWRNEVENHPDVPSAFNNLGFEYFNRGNVSPDPKTRNLYFDSSNILLKEAIRLQPNFVNPYVSLGEVARTRNNFPEAKYYYYKALKLSKSDEAHNAYLGLAIIYCITGQQAASIGQNPAQWFDSAHYCFRTAISVRPYFPEAHSNYGNYFDMMHQFDSSFKEYTISIEQNPDMYASYLNRARLLQRNNKCDAAFKDFAKALEVSPDMGEIYYGRSYCFMQKGDKQHALQDVEHARSLGFTEIDPSYYKALKTP